MPPYFAPMPGTAPSQGVAPVPGFAPAPGAALELIVAPAPPNPDQHPPLVAVLVDYPVLVRSVRNVEDSAVPDLAAIVREASMLGWLLVARAYGAWYDVEEASAAFSAGIDPIMVPAAGPANVPTTSTLIAYALALLEGDQVQVLVLSGDDRLLPVITAAQAAGVEVALIGHSGAPDGPCAPLVSLVMPAEQFARTQTRAERYRRPLATTAGSVETPTPARRRRTTRTEAP